MAIIEELKEPAHETFRKTEIIGMKREILRSIQIVGIGVIIGGVLSYFVGQSGLGILLGVAVGVKSGGITEWIKAALYGGIIGLIVGVIVAPIKVIGVLPTGVYIAVVLFWAVIGAVIGIITCKIFKSQKSWIW